MHAANDARMPINPVPPPEGIEVSEITLLEYMFALHGQARLEVPTVRNIHRVSLRGPAYEFDLVPMTGGRR